MRHRRSADQELQEEAVYRHCLREAISIFALWTCCFIYTVTYCYLNGYLAHELHSKPTGPSGSALGGRFGRFWRDPTSLSMPLGLGIPDWVFYGIVIPWLLCILLTFGFLLFLYREDDLGELKDE